ncbi:MAG: nucleotidyltransferase domain-containing protein [Candidatus Aenigmarchaeota archaeon]|nr:nucleotidyltransferase domain-containing protein [Candidatus Aenigmarchaeota archaeon]
MIGERKKIQKEMMKKLEKLKDQILKKYGDLVKCIVVMGSLARGEMKEKSDVDLFLVLDDTKKELTLKERDQIDAEIEKMAKEVDKRISIQPSYTLTEFWGYARIGHPIIYNFIKEGIALYDAGFFMPVKRLLEMGKIPTTREAIESYMEDAPKKLMRAKTVKLLMLAEDCYYAILNSAQAVLMFMGLEPPVPSKAYEMVKKYLVEPGILDPQYAEWLKEIVEIRKKIEHKELMDVSGAFVDEWIDKAEKFVDRMFALLNALEFKKKEKVLERTHEVMHKAAIMALKTINKLPEDETKIPEVFKAEFIDKGKIDSYYWNVWQRVETMMDLAKKKKLDKVPDKEVYQAREYIREMIRDLSKVLKEIEKGKETKKSKSE